MSEKQDKRVSGDHPDHERVSNKAAGKGDSVGIQGYAKIARRYLNLTEPALMLIHAAAAYVAARFIGFIAMRMFVSFNTTTVTSNGQVVRSGEGFTSFLAAIGSLLELGAGVLVLWAIARLIADAIAGRKQTND